MNDRMASDEMAGAELGRKEEELDYTEMGPIESDCH